MRFLRAMRGLVVLSLVCELGGALFAAQGNVGMSSDRLKRVGTKVKEFVDTGKVAGLVTIIYRRGQIVDVQAAGWQDRDQKIPIKRDTIFRLASMTKPITNVAGMMLVEDGKMALDDPIERWLPELANRQVLLDPVGPLDRTKPSPRPIKVRDVFMYRIGYGTSAAPASAPFSKALAALGEGDPTGDEWLKRLGAIPLAAAPGERWIYNTPPQVLSRLIARVSGIPFDQFLQQRVFDPLKMKDTGFWVPPEKRNRLATAYTSDANGKLQLNKGGNDAAAGAAPPKLPSGSGGLVTTADDYLKFARMLLNKGEVDGVRLLSRKAVQVMTTDYMTIEDRKKAAYEAVFADQGFGYGLAIMEDPGVVGPSVGSFHWDGASGAAWIADPKEDMITIVLQQQYNYSVASKIFRDIYTQVYASMVD
jgi:CubicO group peptidase (beta-lactamase class C family)